MKANWRKYNGVIIPLDPPHIEIHESRKEIKSLIKRYNVLFARWVSDFDSKNQTDFWYVIHDTPMCMDSYSTNTRNQIKKGLKNFQIRIIAKSVIMQEGYDIYVSAFQSYNTMTGFKSKELFLKELEGDWEFWGVYSKGALVGYSQNKIIDRSCDYSTIKITPNYRKMYPTYALIFTMNKYYLNEKNLKYVSDGARSLFHQSNIQEFLIRKFKFRKAFCRLHVLYSPFIKRVVFLLYPFRIFLSSINITLFKKIELVLKQEEIIRNQLND
jgi:hypothetical protein